MERTRSSYNNVQSYDDELAIVLELLEALKPYENYMNEEISKLITKLLKIYQMNFPFYYKDGVQTKELDALVESLRKGSVSKTQLSEAIDEAVNNIKVLEFNSLAAWLQLDYVITQERTAQSLGLGADSATMVYFSQPEVREQLITEAWCPDNKTYIDRVRANTLDLDEKLRLVIVQGLRRGWSTERMSQILQNIAGITAYKADRLIRTETMAVWSKVTKEMYLEEGIEFVEIIGDARCGGICLDEVGKVIPLKEAQLGTDLPPYHPNCCCSYCSYDLFEGQEETID